MAGHPTLSPRSAMHSTRLLRGASERVRPRPLSTRPTVSIVVPCYNYGRYLPAAVASALDQQGVDLDVIIADNGSIDDSLEIAKAMASADRRIRVHTQSENINFIDNFNDGLRLSTGKYVHLLNADDMLTPGAITRSVTVMENRPDVVFTYGGCPTFDAQPPRLRSVPHSWSIWPGHDWIRMRYRSAVNVIRNPEVLMRTTTLREIGGYNADHPFAADMLLWLQAAARGHVARINGADQGLFRIHGANMHSAWPERWLTDLKSRRAVFDALDDLDPAVQLRSDDADASRRALAARAARYACAAFDSRDADERELAVRYVEFALETWPAIVDMRAWRPVQARMQGAIDPWRADLMTAHRKVRSTVGDAVNRRFRRW